MDPFGPTSLSLERLWDARKCQRLAWWRHQGRAVDSEVIAFQDVPDPWPDRPPGWRHSGRTWARSWLNSPPPIEVHARSHWIAEEEGHPQVIMLGDSTHHLLFQAQVIGFILTLRGNPPAGLWRQPWPTQGKTQGTWLGDWPMVVPLTARPLTFQSWTRQVLRVQQALQHPFPPGATSAPAHCWDCLARNLCSDRN